MRKALILTLLLSLSSALFIPTLASKTSVNISSNGTINYSMLIFNDDFENTTKSPETWWEGAYLCGRLSYPWTTLEWKNYVHRIDTVAFSTSNAYSGRRSLVITAPGSTSTGRATEVIIYRYDGELWESVWFYIPTDFPAWSKTQKWMSICNPLYEYVDINNAWYFELMLMGDNLRLRLEKGGITGGIYLPHEYFDSGFDFPKGQWIHIECHIKRHETDGIVDVYVNGNLKIHYVGQTRWQIQLFNFIPIKHYQEDGEVTKTIYYDDVAISSKQLGG